MLNKFKALFGAQDMTVGSPFSCLLKFSIPLLIGNIAQLFYMTVDAAVVGRFVGDEALAAIGSATPPFNFFLVLFMGVGSGVTVMVSQYYGAKDSDNLKTSIGNSITMIAVVSVFITAVATPLTGPMLKLVNTTPEAFNMARIYLIILFLGSAGNGFYNVLSAILRGLGESVFPLLVLLGAVVLNVVLDVLFIAAFDMGIAGAAIATISAQLIASVICIIKIAHMRDVVKIDKSTLRPVSRIIRQIIYLGGPNAVSMGLMFASSAVVQALINGMGYLVVTAITATMRLDAFAIIPSQTFQIVAGTYTGQNIGAGEMERVKKGNKTVLLISFVFTLMMVIAMNLFGRSLLRVFTQTESVIDMGMTFILVLIPAYLCMSISGTLMGIMRGAGDALGPMWISLVNNVALRLPLSYLIAHLTISEINPSGSPNSPFLALSTSMLVGVAITTLYYRAGKWRGKEIVKKPL